MNELNPMNYHCPVCHIPMHEQNIDIPLTPGDHIICITCCTVSVFNHSLQLVLLSDEEMKGFEISHPANYAEMMHALEFIRAMQQAKDLLQIKSDAPSFKPTNN